MLGYHPNNFQIAEKGTLRGTGLDTRKVPNCSLQEVPVLEPLMNQTEKNHNDINRKLPENGH